MAVCSKDADSAAGDFQVSPGEQHLLLGHRLLSAIYQVLDSWLAPEPLAPVSLRVLQCQVESWFVELQ